jgi:hypothetical protein
VKFRYNQAMAITAESTSIFSRVIQPDAGSLPVELAQYVMSLDFRSEDHTRYEELSSKAAAGNLTAAEADELDGYLHIDSLLAIMRMKADRSVRKQTGTSR